MLTTRQIRTWLDFRGSGEINEHGIAALAKTDKSVADAWEHSGLIDDLIGGAKLVMSGMTAPQFETELRQRIVRETDGPEAIEAIWNAARAELAQQKGGDYDAGT
jgi:hypothetical protein